ncbi:MAG: MarR family transcriptional regulator [Hyphomicrobium sp.]|jgi:DNA-binding MarR family transcriptional regulator
MAVLGRTNLGFLLAKATQRWNELLYERFKSAGFPEVRPSYGSILVPLFEEDGLRIGELAKRARLSKQNMTTMIRLLEKEDLVVRRPDPEDSRASRVYLSKKAQRFRPVAEAVLKELDALARQVAGKQAHDAASEWLKLFIEF